MCCCCCCWWFSFLSLIAKQTQVLWDPRNFQNKKIAGGPMSNPWKDTFSSGSQRMSAKKNPMTEEETETHGKAVHMKSKHHHNGHFLGGTKGHTHTCPVWVGIFVWRISQQNCLLSVAKAHTHMYVCISLLSAVCHSFTNRKCVLCVSNYPFPCRFVGLPSTYLFVFAV